MSGAPSPTSYEAAVTAYKQKTKFIRLAFLCLVLAAVFSIFVDLGSDVQNAVAIVLIVAVGSYVVLRRNIWNKLKIEYGLTHG